MSLNIDPLKLVFTLFLFAFILLVGLAATRNYQQRLILGGTLFGFFLFCGLPTADGSVPFLLMAAYFGMSLSIVLGFVVGLFLFRGSAAAFVARSQPALEHIIQSNKWIWLIFVYYLCALSTLITPEFKLHLLLAPPQPDISRWFYGRFEPLSIGPIGALTRYLMILLTPFFYIALYKLREKVGLIGVLLFGLLYIDYVANAYLGRYHVMTTLIFVVLVVWHMRPRMRGLLIATSLVGLPALLTLLSIYAQLRLGIPISAITIENPISGIIDEELSLLVRIGMPILESGRRADLLDYFGWMLTLPLPSFLKSGFSFSLIGYEMSSIYLDVPVGQKGFYVVLPTPLVEAFYLYGNAFFWFHGIFVGVLMGFFTRLASQQAILQFVFFTIVISFAFNFNRAGIGSLLSSLVNEFLLFYAFILFAALKHRHHRMQSANSSDRKVDLRPTVARAEGGM